MFRSYVEQTLDYFDRPQVGVPDGPVADRAAWQAADLDESAWRLEISPVVREELISLGRRLSALGDNLGSVARHELDAPALASLADELRPEMDTGRGFVLLTGMPVHELRPGEVEAAFWALGLALGTPGAQNGEGDLLGHVRDYHDDPDTPLSREYRTTVDINFHCDAADVVGLLCVSEAASGGESRLVSSVAVFNELVARRPDLAARLCASVELDARNDGGGFEHVPVTPVCFDGQRLRTFMHLGYFRSAARHPDVVVDEELAEALDLWEEIASDSRWYLDMDFHVGDIQLCSNHTIAHARRAYVDDPDAPRHLLRLWLTL